MEILQSLVAVGLFLVLGCSLASLVIPPGTAARLFLVGGYGALAGTIAVPLAMRAVNALGLPLSFTVTGSAVTGLAALAFTISAVNARRPAGGHPAQTYDTAPEVSRCRFLVFFMLALIALRITTFGLEIFWRPLFPWDATMHWATKSRAWFEHLRIIPFVEHREWLELGGQGVYTDYHPGYPVTIPLLQVWMNTALGRWDESLMNLPWIVCLMGLGAAFYGQARQAGAGTVTALVFTYLLVSMPLLDTHVALAGYADLFLGACYCLAIMAFHNWSEHREPWQAVLCVSFAFSCLLIKNEGFYWLMTFIPATLAVLVPGRKAAPLLSGLLMALVAVLLFFPRDLVVAGHSLDALYLYYRPGTLSGIRDILFQQDNWHLFPYLLTGLVVLGIWRERPFLAESRGILVALCSAAALFLFLFTFTRYGKGAIRFTAAGRIMLQLVPSFMFLCVLLAARLMRDRTSGDPALEEGTAVIAPSGSAKG